jgi:hypothetical protein
MDNMKLIDLNSLPQEKPNRGNREFEIDQLLEALPHDHTALQLGQALYRCRSLSWRERWHIGKHILQFESPKLGIQAVVNEQDFAAILERRIRRIAELEAKNGNPQQPQTQIDQPIEKPQPQMIEPQVDVRPPLATTNDRRFRRM